MKHFYRFGIFTTLTVFLFFMSCAERYFQQSPRQPLSPEYLTPSEWPPTEYWTGIVFNGARIGFSHFKINPAEGHSGLYDIYSEAYFHIRFLMFDKRVKLKSFDRVGNDLSLIRFYYEYDLDGNKLELKGRKIGNQLEVEILTRGQTHRQIISRSDKIYPTSVITLYPVMHGLAVNRRYSYLVYDGETKSIATVKQDVLAYEVSELFPGQAFRVHTRFQGHSVDSWIDSRGRPLLEMSLGGVIISTLENKKTAQKYLTSAAVNKHETLLDFSLIKTNVAINNPSKVTSMEVVLSGLKESATIPSDQRQKCRRREEAFYCRINKQVQEVTAASPPVDADDVSRYLQPSFSVPSRNPSIHQLANKIVKDTPETFSRMGSLLDWIRDNIEQKPTDVFTALDVLEDREAECQGHSLLYTAFARALTIPTRVVNGMVYSKNHQGFLYHTWAESLVDGRWIAVDPTFQQIPADATHIKLIEGELVSDLLPLADLIGNIKIQILAVHDQQPPPR